MLKRLVALAGSSVTAEQATTERDRETLAPARTLDGFGAFTAPPGSTKPVPANYAGRATVEFPPGFYGPPEGLLAVNTLTAADNLSEAPRFAAECTPRCLSPERAGRICVGRSSWRVWLAAARCAGGVLARWRDQPI